MDQIIKALGLINSFRLDGLHGTCNPTSGARLNLSGGLESLALMAKDGEEMGVDITSQGFGVGNVSLPTPQDPSIALDPFLSHLQVDLRKELFSRLAVFAEEPLLADMDKVINRVLLRRLHTVIRLTSEKILHADVELDQVALQQDNQELIRIKELSLSIVDFDTKLPPKEAQANCTVVLRNLRVEITEEFFAKVLNASASKIPSFVKGLHVELPGPKMIAGGKVKKGPLGASFKVDLKFEAENEMFGILFDRFYVPGTNVGVPDWVRNMLLGAIRGPAEKKLKGLVEVSNESIRINPWPKVPVELLTHVSDFQVEDKMIVIGFTEPDDRTIPPGAEEKSLNAERAPQPGDVQKVLAPGPAL